MICLSARHIIITITLGTYLKLDQNGKSWRFKHEALLLEILGN